MRKNDKELRVVVMNPPTEEQKQEILERIEKYLEFDYSRVKAGGTNDI